MLTAVGEQSSRVQELRVVDRPAHETWICAPAEASPLVEAELDAAAGR